MIVLISAIIAITLVVCWIRHQPKNVSGFIEFRKILAVQVAGAMLLGTIALSLLFGTTAWSLLFIFWPYVFFLYIFPLLRVQEVLRQSPLQLRFLLVISGCMLPEVGVALDASRPIVEHLISVAGFYIGIGLTVLAGVRVLQLSVPTLMLVGGVFGIVIEQNFSILMLLFSDPVSFTLVSPWVFMTYALYFLWGTLLGPTRSKRTLFRLIIFIILCAIVPLSTWLAYNQLLAYLGISAEVI